ncbi:hypothetical protein GCM10027176_65890 [Actinoallomurus bryophytorum]|uniref:hypothetical protein n=1 Tax=Actinoallomurus bryophytorum TaxID=1490222 RepID=UPI003CCC79A8
MRNTGGHTHPRLYITGRTPGHYRTLGRVDGTTDTKRCASAGHTYAVWFRRPRVRAGRAKALRAFQVCAGTSSARWSGTKR